MEVAPAPAPTPSAPPAPLPGTRAEPLDPDHGGSKIAAWGALLGLVGIVGRFALAGSWTEWFGLGHFLVGLVTLALCLRALWLPGGPAGFMLVAVGVVLGIADAWWGGASALGLLEPDSRP